MALTQDGPHADLRQVVVVVCYIAGIVLILLGLAHALAGDGSILETVLYKKL